MRKLVGVPAAIAVAVGAVVIAGLAWTGGSTSPSPPDASSAAPTVAVVQGTVTDREGRPLSSIRVTVAKRGLAGLAPDAPEGGDDTTDAEGRYSIEVEPGRFGVVAEGGGFIRTYPAGAPTFTSAPSVVAARGSKVVVDLQMARGGRIRGRVRSVVGRRVGSGSVAVDVLTRRGWRRAGTAAMWRSSYAVGDLLPGTYRISWVDTVGRMTYHPAATSRRAAGTVTLQDGAEVRGIDVTVAEAHQAPTS